MLKIWLDFQKKNKNSIESLAYEDYDAFYQDYKKKYDELIRSRLNESFLSERDLMYDLFGSLYEDDDNEEGDEEGGDDEGGEGGGGEDKTKYTYNIFVVLLKGLNVAFRDNRY